MYITGYKTLFVDYLRTISESESSTFSGNCLICINFLHSVKSNAGSGPIKNINLFGVATWIHSHLPIFV